MTDIWQKIVAPPWPRPFTFTLPYPAPPSSVNSLLNAPGTRYAFLHSALSVRRVIQNFLTSDAKPVFIWQHWKPTGRFVCQIICDLLQMYIMLQTCTILKSADPLVAFDRAIGEVIGRYVPTTVLRGTSGDEQ